MPIEINNICINDCARSFDTLKLLAGNAQENVFVTHQKEFIGKLVAGDKYRALTLYAQPMNPQ